jgi:putative transcriptional regulator
MQVPETETSSFLLVAMPQLGDPNFHRSVVLLVHHESEGSFGLVLNRPLDVSLADIAGNVGLEWKGEAAGGVGWGGPVQPGVGWIVFAGEPAPEEVDAEVTTLTDGVRVTGSLDVLRTIAPRPPADLRLLLGYAGWGAGQLESELAEGAWLTVPIKRELVFGDPGADMWTRVVRTLGVDPTALVPSRGVH